MSDNKNIDTQNEEKKSLFQLCKTLGIAVSPNSSTDTLIQKIAEHNQKLTRENTELAKKANKHLNYNKNKDNYVYSSDIDQSKRLVRCIITCNNPDKQDCEGEMFTAGNANGLETKVIYYRVPYHVSQIMLNALREKMYSRGKTIKDPKTGITKVKVETFNEYTIEVLDPLTPAEFEAIKQRQLARKAENYNEEMY